MTQTMIRKTKLLRLIGMFYKHKVNIILVYQKELVFSGSRLIRKVKLYFKVFLWYLHVTQVRFYIVKLNYDVIINNMIHQ